MKVTRSELYKMVWATPMSRLAQDFGVSDVALAKTCQRLDVPRPGRGYWARLAAGEKQKRPSLPKAREGVAEWTFLTPVPEGQERAPRPERPEVPVQSNLRRADEVVKRLGALLVDAEPDVHSRLVVGPKEAPILAVTVETHRRAFLLLDALSKALKQRDLTLDLDESDTSRPPRLRVPMVSGAVEIAIHEVLDRKEHVLTVQEEARKASGYAYGIPQYDHFASGRLQLALGGVHGYRSKWSDTQTRRLEAQLGAIVVALEAERQRQRAAREAEEARRVEEERRRRAAEEAQRLQREEEARAKYAEGLRRDLSAMASAWAEAQRIRDFLRACEAALPSPERSAAVAAWFAWAHTAADALDPVSRPKEIPKRLTPTA